MLELADFRELSKTLRSEVDDALVATTEYGPDVPTHLAEAIRHSLLAPAKRLRPLLVLIACEACGYDRSKAMPAAVAVELIHTYSLIHDDLPAMDDDDMRRGRPSCHAKFGESTGILAGDALLAQAFEVLAADHLPGPVVAKCVKELAVAAGAANLVGGQHDDLGAEFADLGLASLEAIHRRKTGAMICVSLRLGAIIAGASSEVLTALSQYGERLGLAFQIVDDLLDLEGDQQLMGKRVGKDSEAGKLTYPKLLGAEASRQRAEMLVAEAIASVSRDDLSSGALIALARYVLERKH